jgi:hypothetical protein
MTITVGISNAASAAAGESTSTCCAKEAGMQLIKRHIAVVLLDSAVLALVTGAVAFFMIAAGL